MASNIYKSPLNIPRTGHEIVTCHYPLRLDTYSGCSHNCTYCYARNLLAKMGYWNPIRPADPKQIRKYFENPDSIGDRRIREALKRRLPVRLGGLTDCFQPKEKDAKVTLEVLKILSEYQYPHMIVTKSDLVAREKYIEVLDPELSYIQVTVVSNNKDTTGKIEQGAPPTEQRLQAIKKLSEKGFFVAGRISPIIPKVTTYETEEMIYLLRKYGAEHVLIEFFRGNRRMVEELQEKLQKNIIDKMYKRGYYYRFNRKDKLNFYKRAKKIVESEGMSFSICSDGDPIHPDLNTSNNCCGTDRLSNFQNCVGCVANNIYFESLNGPVELSAMKRKYWSPDYKKFEEYWKSGEMGNMVDGVQKVKNTYQREKD